ncbi:MAG: hypothetical protein QNL00_01195 [Saprospiraceae bacterium]|jgi:mevalonate kinase|tara:strand:- start:5913 stop:6797 length:885 start_codon:yes stop_codon:yes gene_type:complete
MKSLYNISDKSYSSKIILFGEYSVIHGGEILATPINQYSARWEKNKPTSNLTKSLQPILEYLKYTNNTKVDLKAFAQAISNGMYLHSNIPSGYGLGSSGAITAAIYDLFVLDEKKASDTSLLKEDLLGIESYFHGVSSGIDPLVIYLNQSIHIDEDVIHILEDNIDLSHYFLIDTGISRKTSPFVKQYIDRAQDESYLSSIDRYKKMCSAAIAAQMNDNQASLCAAISDISHWQYEYLDFAILDDYRDLWKDTLDRDNLSIKLCGAGGGGFLLGYAEDVDRAITEYNKYKLIRL